jgi:hypothetical protein
MLISWFCNLCQLIYYCIMREALKHLYSNQITLEDNTHFYYTINPYQLTNALGNIIAVLQEYNFTKKDDTNGQFCCKLYRTKEGNWYDFEEAKMDIGKGILRMLKSAVDAKENSAVLEKNND